MNHFFGQNLKVIRNEKKLSQAELGKRLNKGQKTIGNWETGYSEPCLDELIRISQIFEVGIDSLLKQKIERLNVNLQLGPRRGKENTVQTEENSLNLSKMKSTLQQEVNDKNEANNNNILWQDKYIAVLEDKLFGKITDHVSQQIIQEIVSKLLTLQRIVTESAS